MISESHECRCPCCGDISDHGEEVAALRSQLSQLADRRRYEHVERLKLKDYIRRLRAALQELLCYGTEMDDDRLGYVVAQLDRDAVKNAEEVVESTRIGE